MQVVPWDQKPHNLLQDEAQVLHCHHNNGRTPDHHQYHHLKVSLSLVVLLMDLRECQDIHTKVTSNTQVCLVQDQVVTWTGTECHILTLVCLVTLVRVCHLVMRV